MADLLCAALRETLVLLIGREMARIQYDPTQTQTIQDLRDAFELLIGPDAVIITRSRACANPWCRKVYAGDVGFCSKRCAEQIG